MKKIIAILLASVVSLGVLAGCGKDGGEKNPGTSQCHLVSISETRKSKQDFFPASIF